MKWRRLLVCDHVSLTYALYNCTALYNFSTVTLTLENKEKILFNHTNSSLKYHWTVPSSKRWWLTTVWSLLNLGWRSVYSPALLSRKLIIMASVFRGRGPSFTIWLTAIAANRMACWRGGGWAPSDRRFPVGFRAAGVNFRPVVDVEKSLQLFSSLTNVVMSNNNASNNLIIAQRAVKQLRLEASIRRIKVGTPKHWHTNTEDCADLLLNGGDKL